MMSTYVRTVINVIQRGMGIIWVIHNKSSSEAITILGNYRAYKRMQTHTKRTCVNENDTSMCWPVSMAKLYRNESLGVIGQCVMDAIPSAEFVPF
jgi:hypothetical protein